jgi:hypothetical protein
VKACRKKRDSGPHGGEANRVGAKPIAETWLDGINRRLVGTPEAPFEDLEVPSLLASKLDFGRTDRPPLGGASSLMLRQIGPDPLSWAHGSGTRTRAHPCTVSGHEREGASEVNDRNAAMAGLRAGQ